MPKCQLHTSYNCADLTQLFDSTNGMLCTDFSVLQLPDQIRATLDQLEHRPLHATHELDQYDRVLIFTDGSSRPSMKHYEAQHTDELGYPDTWAMMVVGEIFDEKNHSQLVILGWASYPVRYDPNGSAYMGIKRIGSDMAERAGLIGAAMLRLSHNHQIPTIICTDSDTGGKQAFGAIGAQDNEESFQLLRSLYQTLEIGLPPGDLCLHHVTAHAGDIFNEIVDVAAKQEMKRSLHCPRQKLDLQVWRSKFLHLWTLFGHRIGLPLWQDGVMDIHAPDLPVLNSNAEHEDQVDENAYVEKIQFALSIATANVQSLSRGPQGHAGKLQYLQSQMRSFGLNCMAVQECRTDAGMSQNGDILRYCSGQNQGQYGIEVWIDLRQPYAWTPHGQQHHFHSSHFQCVHADPRRLFLRCDADNISFWLVAFHAPHSGHSQKTCEEWWQETSEILREQHDGDPVFVLCDANAAPGERDDCIVHEDGFKASANTPAFRSFLQEFQLYLPATTNVHDGTQVTWTDPQGKNGYTIDHVALPQDWHHRCVLSRVLTEFDLATLHEDHNAVVAQLQWARHLRRSATGSTTHRNLPPVEYYPGQGQAEAIKALETLPWYSDVETQAQHITQQLHGVLQQTAQQKKTKAKKHYMTDFIWDLRKAKCQAKKTVKQIKHRQKRDLLQECFSAWSKGSSYPDRDQHAAYAESLQCAMLKRVASYHDVSRKLKKEIMNSKQAALQQQLKQFDERTPAAEVLRNLKHFIGPTNPKKCKKKTLPLVRNDQGAICHLPSEATETWVAFFQRMEGGERMPYQELRKRWIAELEAFSHEHLQYDMESLPTLTDLEIAMRRVPRGKAKGPDGLPGELLHHQPAAVARLMYSQLMKMILHGHEFLGFKGGVLTPAYKGRGPYEACTSYRSLLVSNHLGKVMHRVIRQQKAQVYEAFLQGQQTGGRRKVPVQLAMHQVRAFARQAKRGGRSRSIIYLDLTEAFYTVLREMSLGGEPTGLCCATAFWRAEQVDRNETCSRPCMDLLFCNSPAIWNHSILAEEKFLTPWQASINGLDLSHEVGTWCSSSQMQLHEGAKRCSGRTLSFANTVELFVGHEHDIEMARWTVSLNHTVSQHAVFHPVGDHFKHQVTDQREARDDDETSFMATHAAHVHEVRHVHLEEDDAVARDVHEPIEQLPESESSSEADSNDHEYPRSDWHSTMIYSLDREPVSRMLDWNDLHGMHCSIAAALEIDLVDLFTFHHVEVPPQDLYRAYVEPVIAHKRHDVSEGDTRRLLLLDVEFHAVTLHQPPETVRSVRLFMDSIGRQQILEQLGLQAYCRRSRNRCLLWINDELIAYRTERIQLQDGDYVRIAVPPGSRNIDHIATRCIASAFQQGMSVQEILERHTMYMIGWYGTVVRPPLVPLSPEEDEGDDHNLLHLTINRLPLLDIGPDWSEHHLCDKIEDQVPERSRGRNEQVWTRPLQMPLQEDLAVQPPIVHDLIMTMAHFTAEAQDPEEQPLIVHTWYTDSERQPICDLSREVRLTRDIVTWMPMIIETWQHIIDMTVPLQIHMVRPMPLLTASRQQRAAHVILVQRPPLHEFANLFAVVLANSETRQFARFAPGVMHKIQVIQSAGQDQDCLPARSELQCMTWHGDFEIRERVAIRNRNGHSFLLIINHIRQPPQDVFEDPWNQEEDEGNVLLQTHQPRKILHLDSLIPIAPKTVAVRLIDGVGNQLLPTPLEVASPGNPQQVEQELLQWGHDCAVYASDYHSQYLCLPRSEQELHDTEKWCHYWFCHDDMTDVQGTFLHSESKVMTEIDMMFMLCALGYPRAVIIAQKDLQPKWKQVIFHHREPTMPVKEAKLKSCSPWPDRQGHVKTKLPYSMPVARRRACPSVNSIPATTAQI